MDKQINQARKYLYNHVSQETAYVVEDYPWGFRLRTTIRYWIESRGTKNGGQRFCSQTIDPKTGKWCAPKRSTYSNVVIMYLDENNHVQTEHLTTYTETETIKSFVEIHRDYLTDFQKSQIKERLAINEVMKHVIFEIRPSPIGPVSLFSQDPTEIHKRKLLLEEQEKREKAQSRELHKINFAIGIARKKVVL